MKEKKNIILNGNNLQFYKVNNQTQSHLNTIRNPIRYVFT